jgi:hypothetical protein
MCSCEKFSPECLGKLPGCETAAFERETSTMLATTERLHHGGGRFSFYDIQGK